MAGDEWWRDAVFYQIYPRSFADSDFDGVGDLTGITEHMDYIADLGVDALWISPFFRSPQIDHGYDVSDYRDVDPMFGTLLDIDRLIEAAHERDIKVTVDFVPNHTSDQHRWFQAALAAGPGSPERERYLFADGTGTHGSNPPNNWRSVFGGPSWTRVREPDGTLGQWYYHLFAREQPDLNWRNPEVLEEFVDVLRFWLDRGVDGFRIDVSDALIKDFSTGDSVNGEPNIPKDDASGVHDVYRAFRRLFDSYDGDRMAVIETGAPDEIVALFLRPDEMQLAFNFRFVKAGWQADRIREAVDASLAANESVGAPTTWVIDNHDTPRSVSRYGSTAELAGDYVPGTMNKSADGEVDEELGLLRARAMTLLLLGLPGPAYLYNGQELGLPNVDDLPEEALQDPIWERSGHTERGRDGCRIPMPWTGATSPFGFTAGDVAPWLPIPQRFEDLAVARQERDPASMLSLHRAALALRREHPALRRGEIEWLDAPADVLYVRRTAEDAEPLRIMVNLSLADVALPEGEILLSSRPVESGMLRPDTAVWLRG